MVGNIGGCTSDEPGPSIEFRNSLFAGLHLMSKPEPNCKAKIEVVEAGRIELPSEETNDRERSCFSQVHLCLVSVA